MDALTTNIFYAVDLIGTAAFAFSGAIRSTCRRPDLVGMFILAAATAVGGGATRDVMLNRDVAFLQGWQYPLVILASAVLTFLFPRFLLARQRYFEYFDAVGLGAYAAITLDVGLSTPGLHPAGLLVIVVTTSCAGGVIRDVILRKQTLVLSREIYITTVLIGAGGGLTLSAVGVGRLWVMLFALVTTITVRILAIRFDWRMPKLLSLTGLPSHEDDS